MQIGNGMIHTALLLFNSYKELFVFIENTVALWIQTSLYFLLLRSLKDISFAAPDNIIAQEQNKIVKFNQKLILNIIMHEIV